MNRGSEVFELALHGGAAEHRYRRMRPEIERLHWDKLDARDATSKERDVARQQWTAGSLQEYATASAHAATLHLLLRVRAPLDLTGMAAAFPLDEIAHAELCARVANALGGGAAVSYRPDVALAGAAQGEPLAVLADRAVRDFCISETLAHALLQAAARAPGPALLQKVHATIARDEALHGRFGWLFLEWAGPKLVRALKQKLAESAEATLKAHRRAWANRCALDDAAWSRWTVCGTLGRERYVSLGERAIARRIVPALRRAGIEV
ncbi:MAG: hypothetical protein JST54_09720 [Deltaproteobacteria bacterium]|nr:hypothetical protein [Deltaproteobacteria bacterium]